MKIQLIITMSISKNQLEEILVIFHFLFNTFLKVSKMFVILFILWRVSQISIQFIKMCTEVGYSYLKIETLLYVINLLYTDLIHCVQCVRCMFVCFIKEQYKQL